MKNFNVIDKKLCIYNFHQSCNHTLTACYL